MLDDFLHFLTPKMDVREKSKNRLRAKAHIRFHMGTPTSGLALDHTKLVIIDHQDVSPPGLARGDKEKKANQEQHTRFLGGGQKKHMGGGTVVRVGV